jgi:hypothetical protein
VDTLMGRRVELTPAHDAVLAVLDWLLEDAEAVAALLGCLR